MDSKIMMLKEARDKDLILIHLRSLPKEKIQINSIWKELLPNIPLTKMHQYYEELKKEGYIWDNKWDRMNVTYQTLSDVFIESGGFVRLNFEEEKIDFNEIEFLESHHKDLILCRLKVVDPNHFWMTDAIKNSLFLNLDIPKIRYYIDTLRDDGYIIMPDNHCFRYYNSADKFIDAGGYTGRYLIELKEKLEYEKESQKLSPEEIKMRVEVDRKRQYINTFKTRALFIIVKYGFIILFGLIAMTIILILFGVVTSKEVLRGINWLISKIF